MIENFGCEAIDLGIVPDCPATLKATFEQAQSLADVVVTSGGVSVGEADYTKDILQELGEIGFWKLAIKPGKPFAFGALQMHGSAACRATCFRGADHVRAGSTYACQIGGTQRLASPGIDPGDYSQPL